VENFGAWRESAKQVGVKLVVTKGRPKALVAQKELTERKLSLPYVRKLVRKVGVKGLLGLGQLAKYEQAGRRAKLLVSRLG